MTAARRFLGEPEGLELPEALAPQVATVAAAWAGWSAPAAKQAPAAWLERAAREVPAERPRVAGTLEAGVRLVLA